MKRLAVILALVTLAGCQTKPVEEMSYSEVQALAGEIMKRCEAQGAGPRTPQFKACTDQESTREISMRRSNRARQLAAAQALSAMGDAYKPAPTVSCTSTSFGNTVQTNCR